MSTPNRSKSRATKPGRAPGLLERRPLVDPFREKTPLVEPQREPAPRRRVADTWTLAFAIVSVLAFAGTMTASVLIPAAETLSASTDSSWNAEGP